MFLLTVLGREIRLQCKVSPRLHTRLLDIVNRLLDIVMNVRDIVNNPVLAFFAFFEIGGCCFNERCATRFQQRRGDYEYER